MALSPAGRKMDTTEHPPQHPGGDDPGLRPDVSKWWYFLAIPAVLLALVLLDFALGWLLGPPESVLFFFAGALASAVTSGAQEPKTIRHAVTTTAIMLTAGALAMLGYAAIVLLSEIGWIQLGGAAVSIGITGVLGRLACMRLKVPQRHTYPR